MGSIFTSVEWCREEYARLRATEARLRSEDDDIQMQIGDLFAANRKEISELVEGNYSRAVYEYFAEKKPTLRHAGTGKKVLWEEAFGKVYEKTTPAQRQNLVGLVEGDGEYRLRFARIPRKWKRIHPEDE